MYNVFVDFHHASLLQSFILLFEKRLGGNVYRPIGMEWHEKGFWKVYDHPATAAQFLGIGANTPDGSEPLNEVESFGGAIIGYASRKEIDNPIETIQITNPTGFTWYNCHDIDSGQTNKAILFDQFMKAPIDIVIASLPQHVVPFKKLCELHPNKPKFIYQIGNQWDITPGEVSNVMASAKIINPPAINFIEYHQEFDTHIFKPVQPDEGSPSSQTISSFVNVFNGQEHFKEDYALFEQVEKAMPNWVFESHGGQCRDGAIGPADRLARFMRMARFIWHTKNGGDGYGHIIHNAAAVGTPLIVKTEYYKGKLAEPLLVDGFTCITIDGLSVDEIVKKIEYYDEPERYKNMSKNLYTTFRALVDFDREFIELQKFLKNLV